MHVHVIDPSAYTPPYDHALCSALAAAGLQTTLYTSHFAYGPVPDADGYKRLEFFYRAAGGAPASRVRRLAKLAQHVPDMLRYRRAAAGADIVHFQWLTVPHLDSRLLPSGRPLVFTAHDVLPREPRPGQIAAHRRLLDRFDAVIVHSEHGRTRLVEELSVDPERVHVIPHGAFAHLAAREGQPLPAELCNTEVPVCLCFGLMRPYKGIDVLLEAWSGIEGAELWVAGMPRMDTSALRAAAPPGVRFIERFIGDDELGAYFRRADLLVLPYREIDQSGVLATALGFGKAMLLSDVGGFGEVAAAGAARLVPAGEAPALHDALAELLTDGSERQRLAAAASALATGPCSWSAVAERTRALYEELQLRR